MEVDHISSIKCRLGRKRHSMRGFNTMQETTGTCRDKIICTLSDGEPERIALGRQINDLSQCVKGLVPRRPFEREVMNAYARIVGVGCNLLTHEPVWHEKIAEFRGYAICLYDALLQLAAVRTAKRCCGSSS